ncbi:AAA family ATPase [Jeotgalibacillus sp. R-1-5s-1]|uniref:AAA family ATPase n=1 Tax=Jeotgalibacillus sp. R-1-5s-1 TaxID=2555897 RepID=UPI00106DBC79|nr:AAA family ATPase [Jeotgalibacillus sp. R-1-5s-1]TFD92913.1 heme ABC transporter ATP-binding protein CcmA [Jeotgalibacillus sp. R-1-5s-1]
MTHLLSIRLKEHNQHEFPFSLPVIRHFNELTFSKPVTILVGENGTGKSTLLEGIAANIGSRLLGELSIDDDPSLADARRLGEQLKLIWKVRTREGFFLRADDFINFTKKQAQIRDEYTASLKEIKQRNPNSLEALPYARTLYELKQLYGDGLDVRSHGEGFLDLFQSRLRPGGLYLMDEPEAPLSPLKQLTLISMIKEMVKKDAQFIIATHSPILMACPEAELLEIQNGKLVSMDYNDLEHVNLTRSFLQNPEQYLRHL